MTDKVKMNFFWYGHSKVEDWFQIKLNHHLDHLPLQNITCWMSYLITEYQTRVVIETAFAV